MRKINKGVGLFWSGVMALLAGNVETSAQETKNVTVITSMLRAGTVNASGGIWGYTGTDGKEYALTTIQQPGALVVYEIFDGTNPVVPPKERGYITAGHNSLWQEVAGCGGYAYRVSQEGSMGLQVVDLKPLNTGGNAREVSKITTDFSVAHMIYCDETVTPNRLVVAYGNTAGTKIYSLENGAVPKLLSTIEGQTHDMFARGNRLYTFKGSSSTVFIYDISNPAQPQRIGSFTPPKTGYMHQGWLSEDGKYLYIATETASIPMYIYDVSNAANPVKVGEVATQTHGNKIIHNVYVKGKEIYLGHYHAGMRVMSLTDPVNPVEIAAHRISTSTAQWGGAWGVYPYFKSGLVLYGEMQRGFYVVKVNTGSTSVDARIAQPGPSIEGFRNGLLNFRLPESGAYRLSLHTLGGREVYQHEAQGTSGMQTLSLSRNLVNGNYLVRLGHNERVLTAPITLNK